MATDALSTDPSWSEADRDEMALLVGRCRRARVAAALRPLLARNSLQLEASREASTASTDGARAADPRAEDDPSADGEPSADAAELVAPVDGCRSGRSRRLLEPWLRGRRGRPAASGREEPSPELPGLLRDRAEMLSLLERSGRRRVRRELEPWLGLLEGRIERLRGGACGPAATAPLAASDLDLPIVAIAGAAATGKRRLMSALADLRPDARVAAEVEGSIETRYYSARVRYCALSLDAEGCSPGGVALLRAASAVVLLWDLVRPETFLWARRAVDALEAPAGDGSEAAEGPDRVQVCVAVEPAGRSSAELVAEPVLERAEEGARVWCADSGFEHLRCSLSADDLLSVRLRRRGTTAGDAGRGAPLLSSGSAAAGNDGVGEEDFDGTPLRLLEALECHLWPNLERRRAPAAAGAERPAPALPTVVVAGDRGLGKRRLVEALTGLRPEVGVSSGLPCAEGVLETRYYTARLCFVVLDAAEGDARRAVAGVEGCILLWDPSRPETFASARGAYERCCSDTAGIGVRLCVSVRPGTGAPADEAGAWCSLGAFEPLELGLGDDGLGALRAHWRGGGGCCRPLLAGGGVADAEEDGGAGRFVEALQCHAWTGLVRRARPPAAGDAGPARGGATASAPAQRCSGSGEAGVETVERLAEEICRVRGIADEDERRSRACDVAMQLARSLGVDSEDDDEPEPSACPPA
uniref:Uncharacterized protein n=1 Tax=Alexandrium monilatum TaxID=311494 RepID=A0A7S4VKA9_9DINO